MSDDITDSFDVVKCSYQNITVESMSTFYDKWALDYESDVDNIGWIGWEVVVDLYIQFAKEQKTTRVLDYGCGTGIAGRYLKSLFQNISIIGVDVSQGMLNAAKNENTYKSLDLIKGSEALNNGDYINFDAVLCSGVFTDSHMNADELLNLITPLKKNGLLVVSARESYCSASGIVDVVESIIKSGQVLKLYEKRNAPYQINLKTDVSNGTYWVLEKC